MKLKIPGSENWFKQATKYGTVGLEMGVCVFLGILFGTYLDRHFHTSPWLTLIFTLFGLIAAFKSLFRLAKGIMRENQREQQENQNKNDGNN